MLFFQKKNIILLFLSMTLVTGAQANMLCVADDHVEIELNVPGGCPSAPGDSCEDCIDYELSADIVRADSVSSQLVDKLKLASNVHFADLGVTLLGFEVNFSPHIRFINPARSFTPVSLLEKKVTVLLN